MFFQRQFKDKNKTQLKQNKKMFIQLMACSLLALCIILLQACGSTSSKPDQANASKGNKIKVVASFFVPFDLARQIGGEDIELISLVGGGVEPHDWEPSATDIKHILGADLFIYTGAGMEPWLRAIKEANTNTSLRWLNLSKNIELIRNDKKEADPHIWLSPLNALQHIKDINLALQEIDKAKKENYQKRYEIAKTKLEKLHQDFHQATEKFTSKILLVSHEAFAYLCQEYGLKQEGIRGISPEDEPSPRRITELIAFAKDKEARVVFFEELVSPKIAELIAREAGIETEVLNPLEGGGDFTLDYNELMYLNLARLKKHLN